MYACRRVESNHSIKRRVASVNIVKSLATAFLTSLILAPAIAASMTTQAYQAEIDKLFMNIQFGDAQVTCKKALKEHPKDKVLYLAEDGRDLYLSRKRGAPEWKPDEKLRGLLQKVPRLLRHAPFSNFLPALL